MFQAIMRRYLKLSPTDCDKDPDEPSNMFVLLALELTQLASHSSWLNALASKNMLFIEVTLDTSHFETSLLNDFASINMYIMQFFQRISGSGKDISW